MKDIEQEALEKEIEDLLDDFEKGLLSKEQLVDGLVEIVVREIWNA